MFSTDYGFDDSFSNSVWNNISNVESLKALLDNQDLTNIEPLVLDILIEQEVETLLLVAECHFEDDSVIFTGSNSFFNLFTKYTAHINDIVLVKTLFFLFFLDYRNLNYNGSDLASVVLPSRSLLDYLQRTKGILTEILQHPFDLFDRSFLPDAITSNTKALTYRSFLFFKRIEKFIREQTEDSFFLDTERLYTFSQHLGFDYMSLKLRYNGFDDSISYSTIVRNPLSQEIGEGLGYINSKVLSKIILKHLELLKNPSSKTLITTFFNYFGNLKIVDRDLIIRKHLTLFNLTKHSHRLFVCLLLQSNYIRRGKLTKCALDFIQYVKGWRTFVRNLDSLLSEIGNGAQATIPFKMFSTSQPVILKGNSYKNLYFEHFTQELKGFLFKRFENVCRRFSVRIGRKQQNPRKPFTTNPLCYPKGTKHYGCPRNIHLESLLNQ